MLLPRRDRPATGAGAVLSWLLVSHFVCLAWIFFRAEDFTVASIFVARLGAGWSEPIQQARPAMVVLIAIGMAGQFLPPGAFERVGLALQRVPYWGLGAATGIILAVINAIGPEGVAPFIYFRF